MISMHESLQKAGMWKEANLKDATVLVPNTTRIESDSLIYDPAKCHPKRVDGGKVLLRFIEIDEPIDVPKFACRYGVLSLDRRGRPIDFKRAILGEQGHGIAGCEPIRTWIYYARAFRSLLSIAAKLHSGKCGTPAEWSLVLGTLDKGSPNNDVDWEKYQVQTVLWDWSTLSNLRPTLLWSGEPRITLYFPHYPSLFDVLVLALMLLICRTDSLAICASCQRFCTPAARARRGQIRFCDDCRMNGSANRISAQVYRKKKRHKQQEYERKSDGKATGK